MSPEDIAALVDLNLTHNGRLLFQLQPERYLLRQYTGQLERQSRVGRTAGDDGERDQKAQHCARSDLLSYCDRIADRQPLGLSCNIRAEGESNDNQHPDR